MTTEPRQPTSSGRLMNRSASASARGTSSKAGNGSSARPLDRSMTSARTREGLGTVPRSPVTGDLSIALAELQELYQQKEAEARAHTAMMGESIKQSRQALLTAKQEHKELQTQLAGRKPAELQQEGKSEVSKQLEQLEARVHELRRQHDKVVQEKKTTLSKLQNQQDSLQHLNLGTGVAGQGPPVGSGVAGRAAREMRQLENRLEKALLKANEAQSIRHTYEKVLGQLQQEQLSYDNHIKALEATLKARKAEHQQALVVQREAQRAKEAARHELSVYEERLAREREERNTKLQAQRDAVKTLGDANMQLLARHAQAAAATAVVRGGMITGAATALDGVVPHTVVDRPVDTAQEAVAALLAAVPSARPETLVAHLTAQQDTYRNLVEMKMAAVHKVAEVTGVLEAAQSALEELQSSTRGRSTQAALDSAQAKLREATSQSDAAKAAHDLVLKAYVDARAGVEHLASMLVPLPLPPGHIPVPCSDETIGDVLAQCQQRLAASLAFIHTIPKAAALLDSMMSNPELSFAGGGGGSAVSEDGSSLDGV